jgi:cytoskeletal protein RodZ
VERETAQRAQQPISLPDIALAKVLAKKRRRKTFRRAVIAIALVLLVGTGVMITFVYMPFSSKDKISPPKVAEVPRKDKGINAPTVPVRQREEAPKPAIAVKKPDPEPEKLSKKMEPIPLPSRDQTAPPVTAKALQKPAPQIPTRPFSPIEPRRNETIIRDLELQAIVWSEDPGSCSAMINGRLVPLGGEVGGFTVDEIGRNYVSLKSELRSGRLRMIGAR